jgi:hypothetical protein
VPRKTKNSLHSYTGILAAQYPGSNVMANSLDYLDDSPVDWHYTEVRSCSVAASFSMCTIQPFCVNPDAPQETSLCHSSRSTVLHRVSCFHNLHHILCIVLATERPALFGAVKKSDFDMFVIFSAARRPHLVPERVHWQRHRHLLNC